METKHTNPSSGRLDCEVQCQFKYIPDTLASPGAVLVEYCTKQT